MTVPRLYHNRSNKNVSWDAYEGFQVFEPEVFEVIFSAGTTRVKGASTVQ